MKVLVDRRFEKDLQEIRNEKLLTRLADLIDHIQGCQLLTEITGLKKLKGDHDCFRIRLGDYRIGVRVKGEEVKLIRFLSRKDIYKYFP